MNKQILRIIWIALVLSGLVLFFLHPEWFTKEGISEFVAKKQANVIIIYLIISLVRGIFLLPSTPFVLAGIILFPDQPWLVFWISMVGILVTATYLYFASRFLEFEKLFGAKNFDKIERIKHKLNKNGFWIVLGWSFFPFVPTDLICYIAGAIRMNFWKYISAVYIGEAILVGCYIYLGESIWSLI